MPRNSLFVKPMRPGPQTSPHHTQPTFSSSIMNSMVGSRDTKGLQEAEEGDTDEIRPLPQEQPNDGEEGMEDHSGVTMGTNHTVPTKDLEEKFYLEEDMHSFLYVAPIQSFAFWISVGVMVIQMLCLAMGIVETHNGSIFAEDTYNALTLDPNTIPIPPPDDSDVTTTVLVAQIVTLFVAVIKEDDLYVGLKGLLVVGHDESVTRRFPEASVEKWWISNILRLAQGVMSIVVSFFFIVNADSVLSIFENFAALEVISLLDNMIFRLARWGYMGKSFERMTIRLEKVTMRPRRDTKKLWRAMIFIFACLTLTPIIIFWILIMSQWASEKYDVLVYEQEQTLTPALTVIFPDQTMILPESVELILEGTTRNLTSFASEAPALNYAYFSSPYELSFDDEERVDMISKRPVYYERNATVCKKDPTCGMFYYCDEAKAWVFTVQALGTARQQVDKCKYGWLAMSDTTLSYDLEHAPTIWNIWTGVVSQIVLKIINRSCMDDQKCSLNGHCVDKRCHCNEGWDGARCGVRSSVCPALQWVNYGRSAYEYNTTGPYYPAQNKNGTVIKAYGRPVYYRDHQIEVEICSSGRAHDAYAYTGHRWVLATMCEEHFQGLLHGYEQGIRLHGFWDNLVGLDQKRFSESTDSFSGVGLPMYDVRDSSFAFGSSFASGSNTGPFGVYVPSEGAFECMDSWCGQDISAPVCRRKGSCVEYSFESANGTNSTFHKCSCKDGYGGPFCQFSPRGDYAGGLYDAYLNNPFSTPTVYQTSFWDNNSTREAANTTAPSSIGEGGGEL